MWYGMDNLHGNFLQSFNRYSFVHAWIHNNKCDLDLLRRRILLLLPIKIGDRGKD